MAHARTYIRKAFIDALKGNTPAGNHVYDSRMYALETEVLPAIIVFSSSEEVVTLIRVLADFEFSCTLDIVHDGTTKAQNIWGLMMAGRLQHAIRDQDAGAIFAILL